MRTIIIVFGLLATSLGYSADFNEVAKTESSKVMKQLESGNVFAAIKSVLEKDKKTYAGMERKDKNPVGDLKKLDKEWRDWYKKQKLASMGVGKDKLVTPSWITDRLNNACSKELQKIVKGNDLISELFVINHIGGTACMAAPTSDFDQGDEIKFQGPWVNGTNPHVGIAKYDNSSKTRQAQISYLIMDGGTKIGVVTIGVSKKEAKKS